MINRDIKPDNMMLKANNDLVLIDFGISDRFKGDDDVIPPSQFNKCTPFYLAPEFVATGLKKGEKIIHGRQTDIWAAGVTLFYISTGILPFVPKNLRGGAAAMKGVLEGTKPDYSFFENDPDQENA